MSGASFRDLHEQLGCATADVPGLSGCFMVDRSILVRTVSVWRALLLLLFNRPFRGVLLVRRGSFRKSIVEGVIGTDGIIRDRLVGQADYLDEGNPDVVLDYETYCRMVAGLARQRLGNLEMGDGAHE